MQYHTVPHTAKQNHTVQCSTARCRMVHCMTLHDSTLHYIALHRIPFPSYMHTIRYDTDYRFQNSIQKRNIVGDGCRIKPGMHKWPGEQPANATSQKDVFFLHLPWETTSAVMQQELLTNPSWRIRQHYKSYTYTLSCRLKERTRGCQISPN